MTRSNAEPLWIAAIAFAVGFALFAPIFNTLAVQAATAPDFSPALAQTVDFSPIANNVIAVAVAVLTVAAGVVSKFAVGFLASKTKLSDSAFEKMMADRVNDILLRAIDHSEMWMKEQVANPNSQIRSVRVDNFFLRTAVEYAQRSMPDLITYFGLTEKRIEDMIKARLNAYVETPPVNDVNVPIGNPA